MEVTLFGLLICLLNFPLNTLSVKIRVPDKNSYYEFCYQGELHEVSPRNNTETDSICDEVSHFNFEKEETSRRIRIYGVALLLNATNGCPKHLIFGHGQCKDIPVGSAIRLLNDGLWHGTESETFSVIYKQTEGTFEGVRLSTSKNTITFPASTIFYTIAGDVVNIPGKKNEFCLTEDKKDHFKIISQRIMMAPGSIEVGGKPGECPYDKYFTPGLHRAAINLPKSLDVCELSCEQSKEEGAGPGPMDLANPEKAESTEATIPPEIETVVLQTFFEDPEEKPAGDDKPLPSTIEPVLNHPELDGEANFEMTPDGSIPTNESNDRRRKRRGVQGKIKEGKEYKEPVRCEKTFPQKCPKSRK